MWPQQFLQRKRFNWDWLEFQKFSPLFSWQCTGKNSSGEGAEGSIACSIGSRRNLCFKLGGNFSMRTSKHTSIVTLPPTRPHLHKNSPSSNIPYAPSTQTWVSKCFIYCMVRVYSEVPSLTVFIRGEENQKVYGRKNKWEIKGRIKEWPGRERKT